MVPYPEEDPEERLPNKRDQAVTDFFRVGVVAFQFALWKSLLEYAPHRQHRYGNYGQRSRHICSQPQRRAHNHRDKPGIHGMPRDRISSVNDSLVPFFLKPNDWHGKGVDFHRKSHDPPAGDVKRKPEK